MLPRILNVIRCLDETAFLRLVFLPECMYIYDSSRTLIIVLLNTVIHSAVTSYCVDR